MNLETEEQTINLLGIEGVCVLGGVTVGWVGVRAGGLLIMEYCISCENHYMVITSN